MVDKLNPRHTALIIVDMQNDFCSESGLMAKKGKDVSGMGRLTQDIQSLVEACNDKGIPTFYTQQIYDRTKLNDLQNEQYDLDGKLVTCDIAGDGYKFYGFNPPTDRIYPKYNYNVFSNTRLVDDLSAADIKTLVITGVSTQICVETAIRSGFDLGYKIVVPSDLVATTSKDPTTQQRTLSLVSKTYGVVSDLEEVMRIIESY